MLNKAILATLAAFSSSSPVHAEEANWRVASGSIGGSRTIVRYLNELPPPSLRDQHPWLAEITWDYDANAEGMPDRESLEKLSTFENIAAEKIEQAGLSLLAAVTTGKGRREWLYYATERQLFLEVFNQAFGNLPRMPIHITFHEDPQWS
jgi:hypothetical protein